MACICNSRWLSSESWASSLCCFSAAFASSICLLSCVCSSARLPWSRSSCSMGSSACSSPGRLASTCSYSAIATSWPWPAAVDSSARRNRSHGAVLLTPRRCSAWARECRAATSRGASPARRASSASRRYSRRSSLAVACSFCSSLSARLGLPSVSPCKSSSALCMRRASRSAGFLASRCS